MEMYNNKNIHGDARLILALGGIPISPYYSTGTSTTNQVITATISKWSLHNDSATLDLTIDITDYLGNVTQVVILKSTSLSFDIIVDSIKLVTPLVEYRLIGQVVEY